MPQSISTTVTNSRWLWHFLGLFFSHYIIHSKLYNNFRQINYIVIALFPPRYGNYPNHIERIRLRLTSEFVFDAKSNILLILQYIKISEQS